MTKEQNSLQGVASSGRHQRCTGGHVSNKKGIVMRNVFYIIGVVVVVLALLSFLGLV